MTIEQIDRVVREANPVPDLSGLASVDLPDLRVTQRRSGDMQTKDNERVESKPGPPSRRILVGTIATVVLLIAAVIILQNRGQRAPLATTPVVTTAPETSNTMLDVASGLMDAYSTANVEQAGTFVASDFDLISFMGDDLSRQWDAATGYKVIPDPCVQISGSSDGASIRCPYAWQGIRSDEMGFGPYGDNWFDFTIVDGKVVSQQGHYEFETNGFSAEVWEPFAAWVLSVYPDDVPVMYKTGQTDYKLSPESIQLWEQHSQEYVGVVAGG
jgi:hypothetical protein